MIDFKQQKILVQDTADQYSETLVDFDRSSVKRTWKKNQSYQLELTAANDDSLAYSILCNENSLLMGGQEYVIKQVKPDLKGYSNQVAITANHIYYESRRIWQYQKRAGTITYSIQDILHYFFDNNPYGFTWEVIGDFSKVQIENLGNTSALDALNTCVDKFNCVIYPDNKHIQIYARDAWQKQVDKSYLYGYNTTTFSCSWDTTTIQNVTMCYGKQKEGAEGQYYFPPFMAKNATSIKRWGERPGAEISDERFTDKNTMNAYAMSSMQADPVTTMALTYDGDDQVLPGEVWYLRVEPEQFNTDVEVTGITDYPFAPDHKPEVELDNSVRTLLDEDIAQERAVQQTIRDNQAAAKKIQDASAKAHQAYTSRLSGTPTTSTSLTASTPKSTAATLPGITLMTPGGNKDMGLPAGHYFYAATSVENVAGLENYIKMKPENKTLGAMGDSITNALGINKPYRMWAAERLNYRNSVNYGISSTRIAKPDINGESMVTRWEKLPKSLDAVVVMAGVNDYMMSGGVPLGDFESRDNTTFYGACHQMVKGLSLRFAGKPLLIVPPLMAARQSIVNQYGKVLEDYANALAEVCAYYSVPTYDLRHTIGINPNIDQKIADDWTSDGLHPNEQYHELIGKRIGNALIELI